MRKFQYRLERILELKKYHEQEWELKLAEISEQCLKLENEIKKREEQKSTAFLKTGSSSVGFSVYDLSARDYYVQRLESEIRQLNDELAQKQKKQEEVRQKYSEAAKERKVLDKLREKKAEEYYRESLKEEMKEIDDLTVSAQSRRRSEKY
ncbi:MAG: flagellar export protein FliJ [Spirochaetia bacterium]